MTSQQVVKFKGFKKTDSIFRFPTLKLAGMQIFEFPTQVDHQKLNFVQRKKKGFMQNMRVCMEKPKIVFLR